MIPIVRRSVTVTTRETVSLPYACSACGLQTTAEVQVEAQGRASAMYVSANADTARQRAHANAENRARSLLGGCPCPRCGAMSAGSKASLAQWETTTAARKRRRPYVALVVFALALVFTVSCAGLIVATNVHTPDHGGSAAFVSGCFWIFVGLVAAGIAYGVSGPPRRPNVLTAIPPNVRFASS